MIQSYIDYCLSVYGNCPQKNINHIQHLQYRVSGAILGNFDYIPYVSAMVVEHGWMNIY